MTAPDELARQRKASEGLLDALDRAHAVSDHEGASMIVKGLINAYAKQAKLMGYEVPDTRTLDQFQGNPEFWAANARADANLRELERLRDVESDYGELQCRNNELFHENAELRAQVTRLETRVARAESERDTWRGKAEGGGVR